PVVVVVVLTQGFGSHVPEPRFAPPALEHCVAVSRTQEPLGEPGRQHWIGASVVVVVAAPVVVVTAPVVVVAAPVVVVTAPVVVVGGAVVVVVGVGPHAGSVGSPVQEQSPLRQLSIRSLRHLLKALALKPGHAAATSSEHTFGLHSFPGGWTA